ncbi:MAG TPA: DUF433 domain-containing protein [Longimicrobium sp.]|jgi:uncharacterized protein (DUF433 family)
MAKSGRYFRIPCALAEEVAREARTRGQPFAAAASEMLEEAVRVRRVPGIVFADGPTGRRATLTGTGPDVWEVIATWKAAGESLSALAEEYPWLAESQLRVALRYYETYPREIDMRLGREEYWTPERVRNEFPFLTPSVYASQRQSRDMPPDEC